jgi:hypothetical protein
MANATRRLKYDDYADKLHALLESVATAHDSVELERSDGQVLRIEAIKGPAYDQEAVRQMLRETAGTLKGIDGEALKRDLREMRQQDSKGRPG